MWVCVTVLTLTSTVFADNGPHRHAPKQQSARIEQGVRSGQITPLEAHYLRAQQKQLRAEKRQFMADGVISPTERRVLRRDRKHASDSIRREKHDADRR